MIEDYAKAYNQIIGMLLEQAQKMTTANGATLEIVDEEVINYVAAAGVLTDFLGIQISREGTFSGKCFETGKAQACSDILNNPNAQIARDVFKGLDIQSMILIPVIASDGQVKAVLKLTSESDTFFNVEEENDFEEWLSPILKSIAATMYDAQKHAETAQKISNDSTLEMITRLQEGIFFNPDKEQESIIAFQALANVIKEGVFLTDVTGSCLYTNHAYQTIRDMTEEETLGDNWKQQISHLDLNNLENRWKQAVDSQTHFVFEYRCFDKQQIPKRLRVMAMPLKNHHKMFGYLGIVTEILPLINPQTSIVL